MEEMIGEQKQTNQLLTKLIGHSKSKSFFVTRFFLLTIAEASKIAIPEAEAGPSKPKKRRRIVKSVEVEVPKEKDIEEELKEAKKGRMKIW